MDKELKKKVQLGPVALEWIHHLSELHQSGHKPITLVKPTESPLREQITKQKTLIHEKK